MKDQLELLGGISIKDFLRDYWQKKPLLIRQAIPGFNGLLDPDQLMQLAGNEDAQSRLVSYRKKQWHLQHGPFTAEDFTRQKSSPWTVLVQGINHFLPEATALLQRFDFIPHTRLDDLMVSYAPKGGGVGPHFDSYDVFLLQGTGHRRWQISSQEDCSLIENAPLRILKQFIPEQDWVLNPGDMLYLPPHWAHNGIAEDDCMTYSIGFRTPSHQELGEQFLIYLQDRIHLEGMYADPDLQLQKHPSEISPDMLHQIDRIIRKIKWDQEDIANFTGCYLSEPKAHIFFEPPERSMSYQAFMKAILKHGVALDLKSLMLCHNNSVFINGEAEQVSPSSYPHFRQLADQRAISFSSAPDDEVTSLLYVWYQEGFVHPAGK